MGVATAPSNGFLERAFLWPKLNWLLIKIHLVNDPTTPLLLAGNETVVSKAGRHTFGLDRFFSSLRGKVISGVSFFSGYGNLTRYSRPHLPPLNCRWGSAFVLNARFSLKRREGLSMLCMAAAHWTR